MFNSSEDNIHKLERSCEILESIARNYADDSEEHKTIRLAAMSLTLLYLKGIDASNDLEQFFDGELDDAQKNFLKNAGLEYGD